jgi:hypothetical protein
MMLPQIKEGPAVNSVVLSSVHEEACALIERIFARNTVVISIVEQELHFFCDSELDRDDLRRLLVADGGVGMAALKVATETEEVIIHGTNLLIN